MSSSSNANTNPDLPFPLEQSGLLDPDDLAQLAPVAAHVLENPVALRKLGDRVFELLKQDLAVQQTRRHGYGGSRL